MDAVVEVQGGPEVGQIEGDRAGRLRHRPPYRVLLIADHRRDVPRRDGAMPTCQGSPCGRGMAIPVAQAVLLGEKAQALSQEMEKVKAELAERTEEVTQLNLHLEAHTGATVRLNKEVAELKEKLEKVQAAAA